MHLEIDPLLVLKVMEFISHSCFNLVENFYFLIISGGISQLMLERWIEEWVKEKTGHKVEFESDGSCKVTEGIWNFK